MKLKFIRLFFQPGSSALYRVLALLATSLTVAALIWVAIDAARSLRIRNAVTTLRDSDATVYFDWMMQPVIGESGQVQTLIVRDRPEAERGNDRFERAVAVMGLDPRAVNERTLRALADLPTLEHITLVYPPDGSKFSPAELRNLRQRIGRVSDARIHGPWQ